MANEKPVVTVPDRRPSTELARMNEGLSEFQREELEEGRGTLKLPAEMRAVLEAPIPVEDLDILPTGEVYASQVQYRRRLSKVFGPGGWAMVEKSAPKLENNVVMQKWGLYADNVLISTAWGEQEYFPQNSRMSYATALESAKSNALMRCCKDLSIASECWDRHFTEWFKREYCIEITVAQYGGGGARKLWRLKEGNPFPQERKPEAPPPSEPPPQATGRGRGPRQQPQRGTQEPPPERINPDLAKDLEKTILDAGETVQGACQQCGVSKLEDLTKPQYELILRILQSKRGTPQAGN